MFLLSAWRYTATLGDSRVEDLSISGQAWIQRKMDFPVARKSTGIDNSDPIGVPEVEDERSSKNVFTRRVLQEFTIERRKVAKRRFRWFDDRRYEHFEGKLVASRSSVSKRVSDRRTIHVLATLLFHRTRISFPSSVWSFVETCDRS